jgi:type II secretory ATPase GspE/PulE/Tfp pilus assembly ATPase PilB-like protein
MVDTAGSDPTAGSQTQTNGNNSDQSDLESVLGNISFGYFQSNQCLPLKINDNDELVVGVPEEGFDPQILDNLSTQINHPVEPKFMDVDEITDALNELEHEFLAGQDSGLGSLSEDTLSSFRNQVTDERQRLDSSEEAPIASRINSIIADGVLNEASDIHFEPREDKIRVRFRQDGVLHNYSELPKDILPGIISRIKVMADLDIAEQLQPQDGRMNLDVGNREIDVRVSLVPTVHGERAVLRLLDKETLKSNLADLGLRNGQTETVQDLMNQKDGIVLVTGPTGSGKTTSLYCMLQQLAQTENNIITLEDPVEYRLDGLNQIEIKPEQGITFASGLRSVLRQDPDIILVGEIRDRESAKLAVHASLTGHLVFATLHTRSSVGALSRLTDLGLDPYLIGAGLTGILAQRLVRTLCDNCKQKTSDGFYEPVGCEKCRQTGYDGRSGLFEILPLDSKIRNLLESEAGEEAIWDYLEENDFQTLRDEGEVRVKEGVTSREEVSRVLNI